MLRTLLVTAFATLAISHTADAAVVSSIASDTLTVTGDGAADQIALRLAPGAPRTVHVDTGSSVVAFDRTAFSRISVRSGAGADTVRIDESNGIFTTTETTTIETGAGADVVSGGSGAETIATGDDGDLVDGGRGDDGVFLGAGDDTLVQGPGDGFDALEGGGGQDTLRANGSADAEELTIQALNGRVLVSRDSGDVGLDMAGVEGAEVNAAGGADLVDLGDLSGTELGRLDADLGIADGARDTVAAQGRPDMDIADAVPSGEGLIVRGLRIDLRVENARRADDRLVLSGGAGEDVLDGGAGIDALIELTLDGGADRDVLSGDAAVIRGGADRDTVSPGKAARVLDLGDGDDVVSWSPGDADKTIEGGTGVDEVFAVGLNADDLFDVGPNGARVRVTRNANERLDIDGTEVLRVTTSGGTDRIVTSDLAGTATTSLVVDAGGPDLKSDTVFVNGTSGADSLRVTSNDNAHTIAGQGATVQVTRAEPGDKLDVKSGAGDDLIDAIAMSKDRMQPFLDGGSGRDTIVGSPGQDVINGGTGDDVGFMGGGLDTFTWTAGHGNDIVEGQAGTDFLRMNGSGADEKFDVSSLGGRTRVVRDVSNVDIDLGDVERLDLMPAGGNDSMHVADLSGTDVTHVAWELAPFRGVNAPDGNRDRVVVDGTFGNDAIGVTAAATQVHVDGLAADVLTTRSDPTLDSLHIDTKLGADLVSVEPAVRNLLTFSTS
jgi:Ca2+-binding RTX toxin-like protein